MGKQTSGLVWVICIGYCLILACSGCRYPNPRHGVIVSGDFSLELNRIPWMKRRGTEYQGCAAQDDGYATGCRPQPGYGADSTPEAFPGGPAQPDGDVPAAPHMPDTSAMMPAGDPYQLCRGLGSRLPLGAGIVAGRVAPARLHPVPVQPVFSSNVAQAVHRESGMVPESGMDLPPMPPDEGAPQIEIVVPSPAVEEIPRPKTESQRKDRVTRRLETASRPGSWIFNTTPDSRAAGQRISVRRGGGAN